MKLILTSVCLTLGTGLSTLAFAGAFSGFLNVESAHDGNRSSFQVFSLPEYFPCTISHNDFNASTYAVRFQALGVEQQSYRFTLMRAKSLHECLDGEFSETVGSFDDRADQSDYAHTWSHEDNVIAFGLKSY